MANGVHDTSLTDYLKQVKEMFVEKQDAVWTNTGLGQMSSKEAAKVLIESITSELFDELEAIHPDLPYEHPLMMKLLRLSLLVDDLHNKPHDYSLRGRQANYSIIDDVSSSDNSDAKTQWLKSFLTTNS